MRTVNIGFNRLRRLYYTMGEISKEIPWKKENQGPYCTDKAKLGPLQFSSIDSGLTDLLAFQNMTLARESWTNF